MNLRREEANYVAIAYRDEEDVLKIYEISHPIIYSREMILRH